MNWGYGLGVNRCNCPLAQNEKQWQVVGNVTKLWATTASSSASMSAAPTTCACRAISIARVELTFNRARRASHAGSAASAWPRSCSVTSPTSAAFASTEHRRAGAAVAALLLRAGHLAGEQQADAELRPPARRDQPADGQRGGQRRLARPGHRADPRRRRRRRRPRRQRRELVRTGRRASASPISSTRRRSSAPAMAAATTSACSARCSATASPRTCPCSRPSR